MIKKISKKKRKEIKDLLSLESKRRKSMASYNKEQFRKGNKESRKMYLEKIQNKLDFKRDLYMMKSIYITKKVKKKNARKIKLL